MWKQEIFQFHSFSGCSDALSTLHHRLAVARLELHQNPCFPHTYVSNCTKYKTTAVSVVMLLAAVYKHDILYKAYFEHNSTEENSLSKIYISYAEFFTLWFYSFSRLFFTWYERFSYSLRKLLERWNNNRYENCFFFLLFLLSFFVMWQFQCAILHVKLRVKLPAPYYFLLISITPKFNMFAWTSMNLTQFTYMHERISQKKCPHTVSLEFD